MIRIGTIGTSKICENFLKGMKLTGKFEHTAVYSRTLEKGKEFAKKHNCKNVFTKLDETAKSGVIDAVYIASPNVCHTAQCRIFLEHKINVICEKPIVTCADEYAELKALADRNNVIYMEAIIPRHIKQYCRVKDAILQIGKILYARIDYCQRSSRLDDFLRGEKANIFDMSLHAGTLMDLGVYCVYGAVDLLGKPKSITASAKYFDNGADSCGVAVFDYGNFPAVLTYSKCCQGELGSEILGETGTVKIKFISQYAGVSIIKNNEEKVITKFPDRAELMRDEADKFANYILKYADYAEDYNLASELCLSVHQCMDDIKNKAGIKYPGNKER